MNSNSKTPRRRRQSHPNLAALRDLAAAPAPKPSLAAAADTGGTETPSDARADGRSSRWKRHREERRAELLRIARKLIHRRGPDVTMDDIAAASNTSKSIVYRYFVDKAGLQRSIGLDVLNTMHGELARTAEITDPQRRVEAMIWIYLHTANSSPNVYRFITQPSGSQAQPLSHFVESVTRMVAAPLGDVISRERVDTSPGDDSQLENLAYVWAAGAVGFVRGASDWWIRTHPEIDIDDMADQISTWLWNGALPPDTKDKL